MGIDQRAKSFEDALRRAGVRITRQRAALLRVRRWLGLFAFAYAVAHFLLYV